MAETIPAWLAKHLPAAGPGHAGLAVARLASEGQVGRGGFSLASAAFPDGGVLDPCFTAHEEDAVAPPLEWTAPPPGAQELVLVVEDPDAGGDEPFCHWLVWGLPAQKGQILEGEIPLRVGKNSFGNSEWLLPDPPAGAPPHRYVFQLFAVDLPLTLMPGASREELLAQIKGSVVAAALLTATYTREEGGDYALEDDDEPI